MFCKMLTITGTIAALTLLCAADAQAGTNDHFARQRREAAARHHGTSAAHVVHRHHSWGGPTTHRDWRARSHHGPHCPATCSCRRSVHGNHFRFEVHRYRPWPIVTDPYFGPVGGYYGGGFGPYIHIERRHIILP